MMLTTDRIETLMALANVDADAVENFLSSLHGLTQAEALANLELDTRAYGWSAMTSRAIQLGIFEARLG